MNVRRAGTRVSALAAVGLVALTAAGCEDSAPPEVPSIEVPGETESAGTSDEASSAYPAGGVTPGDAPSGEAP